MIEDKMRYTYFSIWLIRKDDDGYRHNYNDIDGCRRKYKLEMLVKRFKRCYNNRIKLAKKKQ